VEYLRLWEISQLKRPTEELKTAICLSLRKGRRRRRRLMTGSLLNRDATSFK
jgi:hypothetical protein